MVKNWKYIAIVVLLGIIFLTAFSLSSKAQKIDAFARVSVIPREGVVRQPYKVTITVHSSTWFAKPLQFANLHINDAFLIPFTRTVSSINYINKKKYATLTFYYLVFPYNTGNIEIPELEISTSIPPEGGYKGEPVTIRTKSQLIKVKPIPSSKDEKVWMVAKKINLKESWSKALDKLKVGDVIEREITITANGTLPSLIQPFEIEKPEFTSIYPKEAVLQDKRNSDDANGVRIEKYAYLFEEEAEIVIPEEEILWWNSQTKRVYKRTILETKLTIAANPDLVIMASLKDSLLAMSAPVDIEMEEKAFPWMWIGLAAIVLMVLVYYGSMSIRYLLRIHIKRRAAYFQSEFYFYKRVNDALKRNNSEEFIREIYVWFDRARRPGESVAICDYLNFEEKELFEFVIQYYDSANSALKQKKKIGELLEKLRQRVLFSDSSKNRVAYLNPV